MTGPSTADVISTRTPGRPRPPVRTPALVFLGTAILTVLAEVALELAHNPHAKIVFVVLLYGAVLPAIVWFWRENRAQIADPIRIPDLRAPAMVGFALLAAITSSTYGDFGHTLPDESSYGFQARVFAAGMLKAKPMPGAPANAAATPPEIFFENHVDTVRGLFSKYPPGWPLLLSIGYLAHCPWLVNPVLGVFLLFLVNALARLWGRATSLVAVLITAVSAYTVLYGIGFLSHGCAAVIIAAALTAVFRGTRLQSIGWVTLAFALVIVETEIRPYTGAVIAAVCAAYTLYSFRMRRELLIRSVAIIATAGAVSVTLFLVVNRIYTGNAFVPPYAYSRGTATVQELTVNPVLIAGNLASVWRWSGTETLCSAFPLMFVAAVYACFKERRFRAELLCLASLFPALVFAYAFQGEASGSFDGERYYFEAYAPLCIVGARGFLLLLSNWRVRENAARLTLATLVAMQFLFIAWTVRDVEARLTPWRLALRASTAQPVRPLVFLADAGPWFTPRHANWNNAKWQTAPTVFLVDPGQQRRAEVACRFGRPSYRIVGYDFSSNRAWTRDDTAQCR